MMHCHTCLIKTFLFLLIQLIDSSAVRHLSHHWSCPTDDNFQYNRCQDPAHPHTTFSVVGGACNIARDSVDKQNLRRLTLKMMDDLRDETTNFTTEYIRCEHSTQQLQRESLTNILGFVPYTDFESDNSITTVYMKMTKFLRLFHKLWCLHSSAAEQQCCMTFSRTFHKLKHRLLSKWWILQNGCGQHIDHFNCETTVPPFLNMISRCEDIRNIIYILLRDARSLLSESLPVIDQI